ncbi:MAG: hypothetical protein A4E42_02018 [Methanoregulaceae archaeon PtaU1.Bin222]|nr:MAG: hypothetical protein A4E42_02018 [Methanoregulaceae archaeon PtaU1.Bin222]
METLRRTWTGCSETGAGDCNFRGLCPVAGKAMRYCASRQKYCTTSCEFCRNTCPCPHAEGGEAG